MEVKGDLNSFVVGDLPTVMYIPDFITEVDQANILANIYGAPVSKWKSLKNRRLQNWGGVVHEKGLLPQDMPPWLTKITERISEESRLFPSAINHVLINEYLPNQGIMLHQDGPAYFPVVAILSLESPVVMNFTPHSTLEGCGKKFKDEIENQSFSEECFIHKADEWKDNHHPFSVLLMPRSLLIFKDDAYSKYLHGIRDSEIQKYDEVINEFKVAKLCRWEKAVETRDRDERSFCRSRNRISLTCRLVLKVHKNLFRL